MTESEYFQSDELKDSYSKSVIEQTWDKGLPIIYKHEEFLVKKNIKTVK